MWAIISKLLIEVVIAVVSDKVVIGAGTKLIQKGVDSAIKGVGITDDVALELIDAISDSILNDKIV